MEVEVVEVVEVEVVVVVVAVVVVVVVRVPRRVGRCKCLREGWVAASRWLQRGIERTCSGRGAVVFGARLVRSALT